MMESPIYSICICNFNMNNTLKSSLETILLQLNEEFEVVVVDDGSSDDSLNTLFELKIFILILGLFLYLEIEEENLVRQEMFRLEQLKANI